MQQDLFASNDTPTPVTMEHLPLDPDGKSFLKRWPNFLNEQEAQSLFNTLVKETPWQQDRIRIAGRELPIPRLQAWFGDVDARYGYSGIELTPLPWTHTLANIKQRLEALTDSSFNSLLANLYRDGSDSVSWHADDEKELGTNPVIASLSLGATRRFSLKHQQDNSFGIHHLDLHNGDLLVMGGETQHYWHHQVPKAKQVTLPRINLTFRKIVVK